MQPARASSLPPSGRSPRRAPRRLLLLYVLATVGPTLMLLYLGLVSVSRQREAIATLTAATARLRLERLADAMETRVADLGRTCLIDARLSHALASTYWSSTESIHATRRRLDVVCAAHAVCADLVVLRGDDGGMPMLEDPLPRFPDVLVAGSGLSGSRRRLAGIGAAERARRASGRGWRTAVALVEPGTDVVRTLVTDADHAWPNGRSPNGRDVVYAALREGRRAIETVEVTTGRVQRLTRPGAPTEYARWPGGHRAATASSTSAATGRATSGWRRYRTPRELQNFEKWRISTNDTFDGWRWP